LSFSHNHQRTNTVVVEPQRPSGAKVRSGFFVVLVRQPRLYPQTHFHFMSAQTAQTLE
jgi:hypothetical protein